MQQLIKEFTGLRVAVVGDLILDRYVWGSVSRISPEAPVPVVRTHRKTEKVGGAGNAAQTMAVLGGNVTLLGRIGQDRAGSRLRKLMDQNGLNFYPLPNGSNAPTTVKTRFIAENQQLLRVDDEDRSSIELPTLRNHRREIMDQFKRQDVVLLSDYSKGVFSQRTLSFWLELLWELDVPVVVDPHIDHFRAYRKLDLLTPNETELRKGMGESGERQSNLEELGQRVLKDQELSALLVTRGEKGMVLFERGKESYHLETRAREVYDVTGAGDTVAGVIALAEALQADRRKAARLANAAAGIVVGRMGTAAVEPAELDDALKQ